MEQPIEIVIRKTQETATQVGGQTEQKAKGKESVKDKAVNTALINAGKQFASYGVSQYGNLTGNTIRQRQIDTAVNLAGYVGQIMTGGWIGAIAVATQIGIEAMNSAVERSKTNTQAQMLLERSGNATINGGRGTHD